MCGGPSIQQQQLAAQQQQFYSTLQGAYQQNFAGQTAILNSLTQSFTPILQAGINQYGFSPQEDSALRSQATNTTAAQYARAARATNESIAASGGGNQFLPTGAQTAMRGDIATAAAGQESAQQLAITQAGYAQGRSNYLSAANALGGAASQLNPLGFSQSATGAGDSAYKSAQQNATQAAQMWESIGGMVGGLASSALGAFSGGAAAGGGGGLFADSVLTPGAGAASGGTPFGGGFNLPSGSFGPPPSFGS